jgi:hypothetical protein
MKKLFPLLLLAALLVSCKKDKTENAGCSANVASVSGPYKFTAYKYKASASSPEEDYFTVLFPDACERDDLLALNANGSWAKTDEGEVCAPPESDSGNWSLSGNTFIKDGEQLAIESFDCKTLVLVTNDVFQAGDKLKIILTRQ